MVFRPSDWADRLCSVFAHYKSATFTSQHDVRQHALTYSKYLMPMVIDGVRSVVLDDELGEVEPLALNFVLNFASDNQLVVKPQ
jgi:hypothetical protein